VANAGQDALSRDDLDGAIAECTEEIEGRRKSNEISGSYGTMHFVALANRAEAYRRKGEYDKALADCASAEEILQKGKNLQITTSREGLKTIKSNAGQAFQKKYGRSITDEEIKQIHIQDWERSISKEVKDPNYWKPSLDHLVEHWEQITGKQLTKEEQIRICGKPFVKFSSRSSSSSSSSSYTEEPRGVFLSIVFGLIGGVGLLMTFSWIYGMVTGWSKTISSLLFILILFAAGAVITFISWRNRWKLFIPLIIAAVFGWLTMFNIIPNGKPATTQTQTATATVNANVNFRKEPATGDNIIRQLQKGDTVTLTGETNGGWTQIKHGSDTGWISTEFLDK
jgi:hypothetical protein